MKMVAGIGRRAWMSFSLAGAMSLSALAPGAHAATATATSGHPRPADVAAPQGKPETVSAKAEIIVLHATNDATGIDPKIGKIPALLQPPFSAYNSYKLLDRAEVQLDKGIQQDRTLPDGGKLAVSLKDIEKKDKDAPSKYVVIMSIEREGKSFLPSLEVNAKPGEYFFVAGQKYKGGILVIGIRIL